MPLPPRPSWLDNYPGVPTPRYATERNFARPTYGKHTAAAASALGQSLIPWQQLVADVAGEIDESGQLVYDTVVITVQRQAGKTTLDLANDLQNCLMGPDRRAWYTAQTGQHANDKFREMAEAFTASPLAGLGKVRLSNGSAAITLANGSTIRPHPPTEDSLHSKQSDKNTIDEAWWFTRVQAQALLGAITPTTTTRRKLTGQRPQKWIMSTEGTRESEYFNDLLDSLRVSVPAGTAFFDFGIPLDTPEPDLDNPDDVAAFLKLVAACHPGHPFLFEADDLPAWLDDLGISEFMRAYGNKRTGATTRMIPAGPWTAAAIMDQLPDDAPICFAAAVGMEGADTTITVSAKVGEQTITEVVDYFTGTTAALARIQDLHEKHGAPFVIDGYGPAADLRDRVEKAGVALIPFTTVNAAAACQSMYRGVVPPREAAPGWKPTWRYRPHPALETAAELAAKRSVGDGAWVLGRRASVGSISALESGTYSAWGVAHLPEVVGIQLF